MTKKKYREFERITVEEIESGLGATVDPPAPFETLRQYLDDAVQQLLEDMRAQQIAYAIPSDDILSLVKRVAALEQRSTWQELESWALRHALPIHDLIHRPGRTGDPTDADALILRKRLRDLLGYVILGLVLTE